MRAILVTETGGADVLQAVDLPEPEAGPGNAVVQIAAAGVNYIDTYHRRGMYPLDLPFTPGLEAAGTILSVGEGVVRFEAGDRVAYANALGAYAERAEVPADRLIEVPEGVPMDVAAAVMLQGMTAHYLSHSTFRLEKDSTCLVHAGAGGVGRLLIQMAKVHGATVFTTVSTKEKAELARGAGADHVIRYDQQDFVQAVEEIAGPRPLDVVYDGVGRDTFDKGLELLRSQGMMVLYGQSSGPVPPVDLQVLNQHGSLFVTRPTLFHYVADREQLEKRASAVLKLVSSGRLDVHVGARFTLEQAARAHRALEGRETTGKVLLIP